tara:strand:- start:2717 stop:3373 length:657 start_codon:yes stop_codon:yes gene_type:complete
MRKTLPIGLLISILLTNYSFSQPSMGVRIGGPTESFHVGLLKLGSIHTLVGMDYSGFSLNLDSKNIEENDGETSESTMEVKAYLRLFMPHAGVKFFFSEKDQLKSYLLGEMFLVFPSVHAETTENGDTEELDPDTRNQIKDALDLMGITIGYGTEYYFGDQFSLGGEFGINFILWNWSDEFTYDYYDDGYNSETETTEFEAKAKIGSSFARMTLNFYF